MKESEIVIEGISFTEHELKVLELVARGYTNKEISRIVHYSEKWVEYILYRIFRKLHVNNRAQATAWYISKIRDVQQESNRFDDVYVAYDQIVKIIYDVRALKNESALAARHANEATITFVKVMRGVKYSHQERLMELLIRLLAEEGWALSAASVPGVVWTDHTHLIAKLLALKKEFKDPRLSGLANLFRGDAMYIVRDHSASTNFLCKALQTPLTPDNQAHIYRTMALNFSFMGGGEYKDLSERYIKETKAIFEKGQCTSLEKKCELYDGLARAQANLKSANAYDTLEEFKESYIQLEVQGDKPPIRFAQGIRAELKIAEKLRHADVIALETIAKEAADSVREKCPRLAKHIDDKLNRLL